MSQNMPPGFQQPPSGPPVYPQGPPVGTPNSPMGKQPWSRAKKAWVGCGGCSGIALIIIIIAAIAGGSTATSNQTASNGGSSPSTSGSSTSQVPSFYTLGRKVTISQTISGIDSVQVSGWYTNVSSSNQYESPDTGTSWDAIDATACAGSGGASLGVDSSDFSLLLSNGSTATQPLASGPLTEAPLSSLTELGNNFQSLAPGQCERGWVLFQVPNGATPTYVQFSGTALFTKNSDVKWQI